MPRFIAYVAGLPRLPENELPFWRPSCPGSWAKATERDANGQALCPGCSTMRTPAPKKGTFRPHLAKGDPLMTCCMCSQPATHVIVPTQAYAAQTDGYEAPVVCAAHIDETIALNDQEGAPFYRHVALRLTQLKA